MILQDSIYFSGQIFYIRPRSASRDLQSYRNIRGIDRQFSIVLICCGLVTRSRPNLKLKTQPTSWKFPTCVLIFRVRQRPSYWRDLMSCKVQLAGNRTTRQCWRSFCVETWRQRVHCSDTLSTSCLYIRRRRTGNIRPIQHTYTHWHDEMRNNIVIDFGKHLEEEPIWLGGF